MTQKHETGDIYTPYETGLHTLLSKIKATHPRYAEVLTYQQHMLDLIESLRHHGENDTRKAELCEVYGQLNRFALSEFSTSFDDLCGVLPSEHHPNTQSLTDKESLLRERIPNPTMRASLVSIRHVVEYIWNISTPRLIHDGTDHGVDYCRRLIDFVDRLLAAHEGRKFSPQERYLLLAGLYLHDIGMQCDVVALPQVRERAEQLGACFETSFEGATPGHYSIEQQKTIRKNHNYLSAAWIDYARRTGETDLGPAAVTIPRDLVDDLVDVCRYHTMLPITDCPLTFRFDPNGRKQLIVALLRFADELDIESNHVPLDTIKTYVIDPRNIVYWWLHNRTRVIFTARNVVRFTMFLHPDDAHAYRSFIYNAFINEFQSRNAPVLNILRTNGIPIYIDSDSGVEEFEREEVLPPQVVQEFQVMQERGPLLTLADEVRTWLRAIRYEVTSPQQLDERIIEMLATIDLGSIRQRVRVRCVGGVKTADFEALDSALDRRTPQGWLISDRRVSDHVYAQIKEYHDEAVEVFTLAEFLQQKIWGPYFDALAALVEKDQITSHYVDLTCSLHPHSLDGHDSTEAEPLHTPDQDYPHNHFASLDDYVDLWLAEHDKPHLSILGAFGTGKTWFCRHYADRQLKCYLKDPTYERLPLLISLRDCTHTASAQQLIINALLEHYKLPFIGSPLAMFQEANRRGKLLLILDGFDEMSHQITCQTMVDRFWELAELVEENSKLILTSRPEYFPWLQEVHEILHSKAERCHKQPVIAPPRFEVLYLEPFNEEQIRRVVTLRLGAKEGPTTAAHIVQTPNLATMARRPVYVDLLLSVLGDINSKALQSPSHLYFHATNKLLLHQIETRRIFTTTADKLSFLCDLAWEMINSSNLRIHYRDIPEHLNHFFNERIRDKHEFDTWDYDLRTQTMLHRSAAGYYEFAHKSLAEYFVAFKFAVETGCLAPEFAQAADLLPAALPVAPESTTELTQTFGAMPFWNARIQAVYHLMRHLLANNAATRLWELIEETRGKPLDQVRWIGGNAATLLNTLGHSFEGANLSHTVLAGAQMRRASFKGADLRGAALEEARLFSPDMENADLRGANLTDTRVVLHPASCQGAQIGGAIGLEEGKNGLLYTEDGASQCMTLLELFAAGGAILDDEQQQRLAAIHAPHDAEA